MSLATIVPPTESIDLDGESVEVTGLSLADIAGLLEPYEEELAKLFSGNMTIATLLKDFPDLAAHIIAFAAGEPDEIDTVKSLPAGFQAVVIETIWRLTAVDTELLGKIVNGLVDNVSVPQKEVEPA